MKYIGEVTQKKNFGDLVEITIENVGRKRRPFYEPYGPGIYIRMPHSMARAFELERTIAIEITPK